MGRTPKPLSIVVFSPVDEWPEIAKLEEQGHVIFRIPGPDEAPWLEGSSTDFEKCLTSADIVIGPRCWYMDNKHRKYLTVAVKQARLRRYGGISKKAGKPDPTVDSSSDDPSSRGC